VAPKLILALDAMGGDKAPDIVLKGANLAAERHPDILFKLFGPKATLEPAVQKLKFLKLSYDITDTSDVIDNHQDVSSAVRQGKNSTMWKAIEAVKTGEAHCVVSAGNTGALMAISKLLLRTVTGVHRPAIASFLPNMKSESVMLDLGANVECDARNLVQFAIMGEIFAKDVLGISKPSVGILNIGSEDHKGTEYLREAASSLKSIASINFSGFIEGDDIGKGTVDVIVTDGFTGNVALKTMEGTGKLTSFFMRQTFKSSMMAKIGYLFAKGALGRLRERLDPQRYNGAVFLGLNGISVKSHGGANALGFATAINVAVDMAKHDYVTELADKLAEEMDNAA